MASDASLNNLTRQLSRIAGCMEAAELRAREVKKQRTLTTEETNAVHDWQRAVAEQRTMLGFTAWLEKVVGVEKVVGDAVPPER